MLEKYIMLKIILEYVIPACVLTICLIYVLFVKFYKRMCDWRYKEIQKRYVKYTEKDELNNEKN